MDAMRLTSTATRAGALPVTCPTKSTEKGHRSCLARGRTAALHPLRRLPRSDQHVPATAANGLITRRRRPTTSRLSRCPSPRRAPRGANASSGCPAIGEAVELTTEELATARGLLRRLTIAARAKATTRARDETQRGYRSGGDRRIGPPPRTQPAQPAASRYQPGSPPPRATASARQDLPPERAAPGGCATMCGPAKTPCPTQFCRAISTAPACETTLRPSPSTRTYGYDPILRYTCRVQLSDDERDHG